MQENVELENIKSNSVVVVAGPTASGKSALALNLACRYKGVVINADASQIYKDIPIISAAPDEGDKLRVEHLLYGVLEANERNSVSDWSKRAVEIIKDVWKREKLPIVTGGTGFYIENLVRGVSPIPETKVEIKQKVIEMFNKSGLAGVYEILQREDPDGAKMVNSNDATRVRRALEIFYDTGISINEWFQKPMISLLPEADFQVVVLLPKLSDLEERCSKRFDIMIQNGALEEIRGLMSKNIAPEMPIMKAIGAPELMSFLKGEVDLEKAVELAKLHTRQYAKRQLTWFRNRLKNMANYVVE